MELYNNKYSKEEEDKNLEDIINSYQEQPRKLYKLLVGLSTAIAITAPILASSLRGLEIGYYVLMGEFIGALTAASVALYKREEILKMLKNELDNLINNRLNKLEKELCKAEEKLEELYKTYKKGESEINYYIR